MGRFLFIPFISIFYVFGLGMLWYGIDSAKRSVEASNWPSVTGTITNLSLRENSDSDGTSYEVKVEYHYSVKGRRYTNSRLAFGYAGSSGRQAHQDILNKLERASSVKVRYNPQHPATSTLSFGIHRSIKFILAFAIVWLTFVFGFTLIWWLSSQPDDVLLKNMEVTLKRES